MMLPFTLLMIPGALSFSVMGFTGGAVTISCAYDREYRRNEKYFCRSRKPFVPCSDLIKTGVKDEWVKSGRFSLYDNTTASVFTVTITDLKKEDSDTYWCAVDRSLMEDVYTEVILDVTEDRCCEKSISLSAPLGESVNISCKYPQSHRAHEKFLCRRSGADMCAHVRQHRDLLFITKVTDLRSAEYWCALQTEDHRYKIFITRVHITVTGTSAHERSPTTTSSLLSSFSSLQSALTTSSSSSPSSSSTSSSTFFKVMTATIILASHKSSDSSLIFSLSVVLVLIIIGLMMLTVFIYKRHQTAACNSTTKTSHGGLENIERISRASCDYTEIKDNRHDDGYTTDSPDIVYSTAELPTSPSDCPDTIYSMAELSTIPTDSPDTIYSIAELPTMPSDSSNTVYASVKQPKL